MFGLKGFLRFSRLWLTISLTTLENPLLTSPRLDSVSFRSISVEDNFSLTSLILLSEIDRVMALCDGNKSPGPDGFNLSFFKRFWPLLRDDFGEMLAQFHMFSNLPHRFTSFFVTLVLKVDSPFHLGDFRSISLVGSLYKTIFKVLVARLSSVIDKLISSNQSVFLKGRLLVDTVVVVNEFIDLVKWRKILPPPF